MQNKHWEVRIAAGRIEPNRRLNKSQENTLFVERCSAFALFF
jgi:hypothetical protein